MSLPSPFFPSSLPFSSQRQMHAPQLRKQSWDGMESWQHQHTWLPRSAHVCVQWGST